ncbi:glycoside hydrolase family 26 protein [Mucilaginibacter daejeonensis]|uniref:glycoside hydrolase family 26 protein n=1 Tax=Mucilaginibacter daejeonensis TaxID=398049 RepID=UPI001D174300|nr:glycosyl hydrolase [Mucilaginibacter daejeonensis]UEG51984.1 glycoside hydrolase family 26 protein [Mucilaginibacter daejeonensis]
MTPSDPQATTETRWLYSSLNRLLGAGVLFGHHDDTAYGVGWKFKDSSDVQKVTGNYPALYGWDLSGIELDSLWDINQIPFTLQTKLVREAYERGGVNTFCWHMNNPVTLKTSWDTSRILLKQLLPGGDHHEVYVTWLDRAAKYLGSLKGSAGESIPILFRPFHEFTGNWFWWGVDNSEPADLIALWRFTVDHLRKERNLHNLIMVYSAADFYSEDELLERYPGDEYVDVMGFDRYSFDTTSVYKVNMKQQLELLTEAAATHHKLACIAETGYQGIPQADWWTTTLLPILKQYQEKVSYLMIWRNNGPEHYYIPFPGHAAANDLQKLTDDSTVILQNRLTPLQIYGPRHSLHYGHF